MKTLHCLHTTEFLSIWSSLPRSYTLQSSGKKNIYNLKEKGVKGTKSVAFLPFPHSELRCSGYSSNFEIELPTPTNPHHHISWFSIFASFRNMIEATRFF